MIGMEKMRPIFRYQYPRAVLVVVAIPAGVVPLIQNKHSFPQHACASFGQRCPRDSCSYYYDFGLHTAPVQVSTWFQQLLYYDSKVKSDTKIASRTSKPKNLRGW